MFNVQRYCLTHEDQTFRVGEFADLHMGEPPKRARGPVSGFPSRQPKKGQPQNRMHQCVPSKGPPCRYTCLSKTSLSEGQFCTLPSREKAGALKRLIGHGFG